MNKVLEIRKAFAEKLMKREEQKLETKLEDKAIKQFKRRVLGFCGTKTIIPKDKLAGILIDSGIVKENPEKFIRSLYEIKNLYYNYQSSYLKFIDYGVNWCKIEKHEIFDKDWESHISDEIKGHLEEY